MTVRALIVDDSPTVVALVKHLLDDDPEIEVVGSAGDANEARALIKQLDPDVITLDIEMPGMNGLDFLERLMRLRPMPVIMLSTLTSERSDVGLEALELGAFHYFDKIKLRSSIPPPVGRSLIDLIKAAGKSRVRTKRMPKSDVQEPAFMMRENSLIAIGSSTGGVEALIELLSVFPKNCPPTLIVQHISPTFTERFAARLDRVSAPSVSLATQGAPLLQGNVYIAPSGSTHLELGGFGNRRFCRIIEGDRVKGHRPSVDRLFHTVAKGAGADAVGTILTGMGDDGAEGLLAMRQAGARTFGQDEATSLVYGMPAVAHKIGAVEQQVPLERMASKVLTECRA